jgi:hypothetical protein
MFRPYAGPLKNYRKPAINQGHREQETMTPADRVAGAANETSIWQLIRGFQASQALHAAAKLGVVDILAEGPKTAGEIASVAGAEEPGLRRLLRFLTAIDVLTEDMSGRFAPTEMGALLGAEHPQSVKAWAAVFGSPQFWRPWGQLTQALRSGQPGFNLAFGEPHFTYLSHNPEEAAAFNAAMTSGTRSQLGAILNAYDFSGFARVVDVGGGQGGLLRAILERCPQTQGVLFDMPSTVAGELKGSAVEARCEFSGGDMFQDVPMGGDAYVLKWILHDWSDTEGIQILRNIRQAMRAEGKLIVIERLIGPSNQPDPVKWGDLMMLVMLTGRERTEVEFRDMFAAAGFKLTRVLAAGEFAVMEGTPD